MKRRLAHAGTCSRSRHLVVETGGILVSRTLYQRASSAQCRAARWVLERKRLACAVVEVDAAAAALLLRRHGGADVPLLEEDGSAVAGLVPIVSYLERTHGPPSVFPADAQKRNQAATLAEFAERAIGPVAERLRGAERDRETPLRELRVLLGQVREAIARRALDSGACHLGDLAVAAWLVACRELPELEFDREYADLAAYVARVRAALRGR